MVGAAGAAGRDGDSSLVESCQQAANFPLPAADAEAQVSGKALGGMAEEICIWEAPQQFVRKLLAESRQAVSFFAQFSLRDLGGGAEPHDARYIFRGRALAALLAATEYDRR